jgi:hypothetical protein
LNEFGIVFAGEQPIKRRKVLINSCHINSIERLNTCLLSNNIILRTCVGIGINQRDFV